MSLLPEDENGTTSPFVSYNKPRVTNHLVVGGTAKKLSDDLDRMSIKITNIAANTKPVYVGFDNTVTDANGDEIAPGSAGIYDIASGRDSSGTGDLRELWANAPAGFTLDIRVVSI